MREVREQTTRTPPPGQASTSQCRRGRSSSASAVPRNTKLRPGRSHASGLGRPDDVVRLAEQELIDAAGQTRCVFAQRSEPDQGGTESAEQREPSSGTGNRLTSIHNAAPVKMSPSASLGFIVPARRGLQRRCRPPIRRGPAADRDGEHAHDLRERAETDVEAPNGWCPLASPDKVARATSIDHSIMPAGRRAANPPEARGSFLQLRLEWFER
jgi:hypothetical protein